MWLGEIPFALRILTLPERLLVSLNFPAAYIVKLYSKDGSPEIANGALRGNVSTYKLHTEGIVDIVDGNRLPHPPQLLAATIAVTFVGRYKRALGVLPGIFRVRRNRVYDALVWLRQNNPLYKNFDICNERLDDLPVDAVPDVILDNVRLSTDTDALAKEHASYVPDQETGISGEDDASHAAWKDAQTAFFDEPRPDEDDEQPDENQQPADTFSLRPNVVVDVAAEAVTEADLFGHAVENTLPPEDMEWYGIRRGDAFVNECIPDPVPLRTRRV
ncbi:ATP-dependent DNA helicase [Mycena chlorophos]|uniref:ATP-dependent DNA helicase n=1 Tax=Mycena chlorophos TaxID=658473 RepID=A0A8H6TH21_MYCCL|nr:ATP-dependent DNA helicase [Mycena chlorophos]